MGRIIEVVDSRLLLDPVSVHGLYSQGMNREEREKYGEKLRVFKLKREKLSSVGIDTLLQENFEVDIREDVKQEQVTAPHRYEGDDSDSEVDAESGKRGGVKKSPRGGKKATRGAGKLPDGEKEANCRCVVF